MAHHVEPMDVDNSVCDFDNKENSLHNSNVYSRTPCTEKGYEELDVTELNMKLRYSVTPTSSPMSKSFTANCNNNQNQQVADNIINNENSNLTRSLNLNLTRNDKLPLQALPIDKHIDTNRNPLMPIESMKTPDNITVTVSAPDDHDVLSLPSSSSSLAHTPAATTPTKEKKEEASPILRGLKSVLNMFRPSQSPIPHVEEDQSKSETLSPPVVISPETGGTKPQVMLASTPLAAQKTKDALGKSHSPNRDSIIFNEDLEKELQWKDESTILFSQEKIPIHKLFFQNSPMEYGMTLKNLANKMNQEEQNDKLDATVEYMDISYNDSVIEAKSSETLRHKQVQNDMSIAESDSEFVDCESTFVKEDSKVAPEVKPCQEDVNNKHVVSRVTEPTDIINISKATVEYVENTSEYPATQEDVNDLKQVLNQEDKPVQFDETSQIYLQYNDSIGDFKLDDVINDPLKMESPTIINDSEINKLQNAVNDMELNTTLCRKNASIDSSDKVKTNEDLPLKEDSEGKLGLEANVHECIDDQNYNLNLTIVNEQQLVGESTMSIKKAFNLEKHVDEFKNDTVFQNKCCVNVASPDLSNESQNNSNSDPPIQTPSPSLGVSNLSIIPLLADPRVLLFNIDPNIISGEIKPQTVDVTSTSPADIPLPDDDDVEKFSSMPPVLDEDNLTEIISESNAPNSVSTAEETAVIQNESNDEATKLPVDPAVACKIINAVSADFIKDFEENSIPAKVSSCEIAEQNLTNLQETASDIDPINLPNVAESDIQISHDNIKNVASKLSSVPKVSIAIPLEQPSIPEALSVIPLDANKPQETINVNVSEEEEILIHQDSTVEKINDKGPAEIVQMLVTEQLDESREKVTDITNLPDELGTDIPEFSDDNNYVVSSNSNSVSYQSETNVTVTHCEIISSNDEPFNGVLSKVDNMNKYPDDTNKPQETVNVNVSEGEKNLIHQDCIVEKVNNKDPVKIEQMPATEQLNEPRDKVTDITDLPGELNTDIPELSDDNNYGVSSNTKSVSYQTETNLTAKNCEIISSNDEPFNGALSKVDDITKNPDEEIIISGDNSPFINVFVEELPEKSSKDFEEKISVNGQIVDGEIKIIETPPGSPVIVSRGTYNLSNTDEELFASGDNSPFVHVSDEELPEKSTENFEEVIAVEGQIVDVATKIVETPPSSPKIVSRGTYNFNFDEIDDPFATKTKIRLSPFSADTSSKEITNDVSNDSAKVNANKNRRKTIQPYRKKSVPSNKKLNSTFAGSAINDKEKLLTPEISEPVIKESTETNCDSQRIKDYEAPVLDAVITDTITDTTIPVENNSTVVPGLVDKTSSKIAEIPFESISNVSVIREASDNPLSSNVNEAKAIPLHVSENMTNKCETTLEKDTPSSVSMPVESTAPVQPLDIIDDPKTSSSELSTYFSAGTSSNEDIEAKSVFNLPEIDDMNFNPFATKSKVRQFPTPHNDTIILNNISPEKSTAELEDLEKDVSDINSTDSSKNTDEKNVTVRTVHTEDEDTVEGPFLDADDRDDKLPLFKCDNFEVAEFEELPTQINDDASEFFIDAEAYEFLLNQNANIVADSGKESLFLKFDPLFAKRMSSEGAIAALREFQKKQSTPKRNNHASANETFVAETPLDKPSSFDVTQNIEPVEEDTLREFQKNQSTPKRNIHASANETFVDETPLAKPSFDLTQNIEPVEESTDDLNITVIKPMMVVNPAIIPTVTPRNKTATPARLNRQSLTFTSPAIAVIDRLLSMSSNNSFVSLDNTVAEAQREPSETDHALNQLRELLADKEISVYNLRTESKELKERLTTLETQMKSLEKISEERMKKIDELTEKLNDKTKINKSMAAVVEEYERTIASLISKTEQDRKRHAAERMELLKERDEQTNHLASMEISFNDLHSKYEKSKQVILGFKANEEVYKKSIKEFEENFAKMQKNYELLKQHATSKLNHANEELQKMNRAHEAEVLKLNAMIKRKELHITSLEETLSQKTKANEELTKICDELLYKV